jgi:hypothetical protein
VEFKNFIETLRNKATDIGAQMEDYRLHVTLAKVPVETISLENLQQMINGIDFKEFTQALTEINYNYRRKDPVGRLIANWSLEKATKRFTKEKDMWNYRKINYEVMADTKKQYENARGTGE